MEAERALKVVKTKLKSEDRKVAITAHIHGRKQFTDAGEVPEYSDLYILSLV